MTSLKINTLIIPAATLGPENALPNFREPEDRSFNLSPDISEEDRRHIGWKIGHRILPHRLQDEFDANRQPRAFKAIVLENEFLTASFLPELGGRLISLIHRPSNRELLSRNPVFQPGNLALRGAWFSGGIEWNAGQFGHHTLTCSPIFAARIESLDKAPGLRLYEWDRVKGFAWQIDFHLPPGSPFLFSRVRLVNPHAYEIPMYWWTNMAVPETPETRILAPAETAIHHVPPDMIGQTPVPVVDGRDITFAVNFRSAHELFFRLPPERRPWIAALDQTGKGLIQTSTARLRGRKVFYWGMGNGGRRWQDFLNGSGAPYIEIQAGLARTQMESLPMPAHTEWTWTEAFGLMETDQPKRQNGDWNAAIGSVENALNTALPSRQLETLDVRFAGLATTKPVEILAFASGWGALERRRCARSRTPDGIPPEFIFDDATLSSAQAPWLALLEQGELPTANPLDVPETWMVQDDWRQLLEAALNAGKGDHWLSWLHLGNMRMEAFDPAGAKQAWERSLEKEKSGWALRNLAVLARLEKRKKDESALLAQAWKVGPKLREFAVEYIRGLKRAGRYKTLRKVMAGMPDEILANERIALLVAQAAVKANDLEAAEPLFHRSFVTIREGESSLSDLWFEYKERQIAAEQGCRRNKSIRKKVRQEFPPPFAIDFRIGG